MANFTRQAIMDACIRLLGRKSLNKITVRDIVEECGISRNSFYYHFEDVPSLLKAIMVEKSDAIIEEHAETGSLIDCLRIASEFITNNKKAMLNVYKHSDRALFEQTLEEVCRHTIRSYFMAIQDELKDDPELRNMSEEDKLIIERFLTDALFGSIINWLNHDMEYNLIEQFVRSNFLYHGKIGELIEHHIIKKTQK